MHSAPPQYQQQYPPYPQQHVQFPPMPQQNQQYSQFPSQQQQYPQFPPQQYPPQQQQYPQYPPQQQQYPEIIPQQPQPPPPEQPTSNPFGAVLGSNTMEGFNDSFSEKTIRMAFIRKVYTILMVQLTITVAFICWFLYEPNTRRFVQERRELFYIALVLTIVLMIVLVCCEGVRRSFPGNFICLFLFTLCESFLLGVISSQRNENTVLMAVGISAAVCLALTVFAFQTKIDFTICSGFLFVALIILIVFGIITIFFPGRIMHIIYASLGALIFSMYLVVDTQLMMGGKHKYSISPEEYIFAALNLYLDIINLFLMILSLITSIQND